eukprot:1899831-Amphidinium_carterae.1
MWQSSQAAQSSVHCYADPKMATSTIGKLMASQCPDTSATHRPTAPRDAYGPDCALLLPPASTSRIRMGPRKAH